MFDKSKVGQSFPQFTIEVERAKSANSPSPLATQTLFIIAARQHRPLATKTLLFTLPAPLHLTFGATERAGTTYQAWASM